MRHSHVTILGCAALLGLSVLSPGAAGSQSIQGFTPASGAREKAAELQFMATVSPGRVSKFHRYLTVAPHRATSPRNNLLANWMADQWRAQGWDEVEFRKYHAYFTTPRRIELEMTAPHTYRASLREDALAVDPSTQRSDLPMAYNAYSASGDVTAEVVYAGGGNPEEFDLLRAQGISVKGKIVLVRYSYPYSFRGFKVANAEREGAAAVILYSDPKEDGFSKGATFPNGPWGPDSHLQRGFTANAPVAPGDPTTPGWASVAGARHLTPKDSPTLPKIMVTAISARDARPLLESMTGPLAPKDWQGGLPIAYRLAGGVKAHLRIDMDAALRTFTNVQAVIKGSEHPEQIVLLGNHRDAWTFGATDPGSGTAALLELTSALGALRKTGWRPKRTIMVASWDGEEEGLIGSTEWAEQYADVLKHNLVAYLNVDLAIFGAVDPKTGKIGPHLNPYSVASLAPMIVETSKDVASPGGGSLYDAWRKTRLADLEQTGVTDAEMIDTGLDASSDHTAFILHLGRPVLGLTYSGAYGVYHSIYDDRYFMEHFGDPGFTYSSTIARFWGLLGMRLADADVLPFDYVPYANMISRALSSLEPKASGLKDFEMKNLIASATAFQEAARHAQATGLSILTSKAEFESASGLNAALMAVEGNWIDNDGLPGRPWNKHLVYGMKRTFLPLMLPGLTEAIERRDAAGAADQAKRLANALNRNAALLNSVGADH